MSRTLRVFVIGQKPELAFRDCMSYTRSGMTRVSTILGRYCCQPSPQGKLPPAAV
jgi:hypothetical protein